MRADFPKCLMNTEFKFEVLQKTIFHSLKESSQCVRPCDVHLVLLLSLVRRMIHHWPYGHQAILGHRRM